MTKIKNLTISQDDYLVFKVIGNIAKENNLECYLVGGYIRDLLLGRSKSIKDMDFVVVDPQKKIKALGVHFAEKVVKTFSEIGKVTELKVQKNFGTAQFKFNGADFEFVGARKESYDRNSRKPVVEDGSLQDDSLRRDFTINDIYLPLHNLDNGDLHDPFNGIEDLRKKTITCPTDPNITFSDDPLRMLRAIRFATILKFNLSKEVRVAIVTNLHRLKIISKERITSELNKILESNNSHVGLESMASLGLLKFILPEVYELRGREKKNGVLHKDNLYHTIQVLKNWDLTNKTNLEKMNGEILWMKWAALLHDTGKVATKRFDEKENKWTFHQHQTVSVKITDKVFRRLKLPLGKELDYVKFIIGEHERIKISSTHAKDSAIRRLIVLAGDNLWDLFLFGINDTSSSLKDIRQKRFSTYITLYDRALEITERDNLHNFQPPIGGNELIEMFDLKPSKTIGILKNELKDAILDGRVKNDYALCKDYIIKYAKEKLNLVFKQ